MDLATTDARVGIIGLGYVGLPLAVEFAEAGHDVVALDVDPSKVAAIGRSESYIEDIPSARLADVRERLTATTSYARLADVDAVIIAVPTPLNENREPDLQPLLSAGAALAGVLREGQLVVLESTTYPGTTRDRLAPLLEESGLHAGRSFNLAFSPERIDPGRTDFTLRTTPKVVGGLTPECLERATALYRTVCDAVVPVSSPEVAELDEAAREHLPLGQHRARQRDRDPLRPHEHRRLGGRRGGRDEAVRLHVVQAGSRHGRPLPAGRPVLPGLEGA